MAARGGRSRADCRRPWLRAAVLVAVAWAATLTGCGAAAPSSVPQVRALPGAGWHYEVTVAEDLESAAVRVCFAAGDAVPRALQPGLRAAFAYARNATHLPAPSRAAAPRKLGFDAVRRELSLDGVAPGDCVTWDVAFGDAAGATRPLMVRAEEGVLLGTSFLFWGPPQVDDAFRATLRFVLPRDVEAHVPFAVDDDGTFRAGPSLHRYVGAVAFSRGHASSFRVGAAAVRLHVLGALGAEEPMLRRWISHALRAAQSADPGLVERLLVNVVTVPVAREPVAFGQLLRGGGKAVTLYVSEGVTEADLARDWVLLHELAHLLAPFSRDAWFSEGVATYFQEILVARARALPERDAWEALDRGFVRGAEAGLADSLARASAEMHARHAYVPVYWAGAALAFEWDVALRERGGEPGSLEALLAGLRGELDDEAPAWEGRALVRALDARLGEPLLTARMEKALVSKRFPDVRRLYDKLGIARGVRGNVRLRDDAPLARERAKFFEPLGPAPADARVDGGP